MKKVMFNDLENVKELKKEGKGFVWSPFVVDEFMGFTTFRVRATEGLNGEAVFKFTEQYVMSGNSPEKECNEDKYVSRMKNDLEKLLETL